MVKDAVGAFVVYDVTNFNSLEASLQLKKNLDSKVTLPNGTPIPCVLLSNKVDLPKEEMLANQTYIDQLTEEHGFAKQFDTSAKENIGIKEATTFLIDKVLEAVVADGPAPAPDSNIVRLDKVQYDSEQQKKKSKCCSG